MVDLRFGGIVAGAASLLLGGCMFAVAPQTFDKPYPRSGGEVRKAIGAALEHGDSVAATRRTMELAWMGGTLSDATIAGIAPSLDAGAIQAIRARPLPLYARPPERLTPSEGLQLWLQINRHTYLPAEPFAEVPADYRLVEGIAWDEKTRRLFVGTVVEGRLAYRDENNAWHEVPIGSPRGGLFGMAVDAPRRLLWIATGSVEQTAVPGERMTGLIAVDLDTLKVVRRVPLAPGVTGAAGDLAVAWDGTVYVSNVLSGAIHRCLPGCATLSDFIAPGKFRNPQGLAVSPDGKRLYIADYISGLWVADPRTAQVIPIRIGEPTMLEGIDGLTIYNGKLVAIQNGTSPRRVTVFTLDRDGDRIVVTHARVTIAADAGEPTLGTVDGSDHLLMIGDGQWERYAPGGMLKDNKPPRGTPILRVDLADIVVT